MAKNILLLFLSYVKKDPEKTKLNGKVVISEARYVNIDGENTQTTSESAFRYLLKKFPIDKMFIFASKGVNNEIEGYRDDDGNPQTHLSFTLARFKKFLPDVDYFIFNYDEYGNDNDNLKSIAQMAKHIQEYVESVDGHDVTLHVDLTGGMRHVNMMMLELTRLLQYSGLHVGNVLYSNYDSNPNKPNFVEEVQNVYDLFQLIAGVEEFVNFGSVKALVPYYAGRKLSEPLKKLYNSMGNFADAIKLCHYGQFREAIQNLHDAVHDFGEYEPENVEDILMARLIKRIHDDYHDLIVVRDKDDLRIIHWCLENDYLQQALTLYTERIPEYLGEKFISQSEDEANKLSEYVKKDKMGRNHFYILLTDYPLRKNHTNKAFKKLCDAVKSETVGRKSPDLDAWIKSINERLAPFNVSVKDEALLRSQVEIFNKIRQSPDILNDLTSPALNPIRAIINELFDELLAVDNNPFMRGKIIFDFVNKLTNDKFTKFFPDVVFEKNIFERFPRAHKVYELLFDKIFSVNIPQENFLNIMEKYFIIQSERNHSNHAREDFGRFTKPDDLRDFMFNALDEIKANLPAT
ncbi:MAG: TM1812 family CRISPR-associated protein [Selenomonadaceae bacterium]|nr:TM1812 family CRISPR-associated protein [Selenomonadaceae bacterium]